MGKKSDIMPKISILIDDMSCYLGVSHLSRSGQLETGQTCFVVLNGHPIPTSEYAYVTVGDRLLDDMYDRHYDNTMGR